jgi:site-specific DNA-cytosine methylase/predicted DNA-binding transcriptional regulator AlpA
MVRQMSQLELLPSAVIQDELGLSRSTLWRLRQQGLPSLKVGGSIRYQLDDVRTWVEQRGAGPGVPSGATHVRESREGASPASDGLLPCHWSTAVALDPKHRPQVPSSPSSTARKDWRKYPQEAHLLDQKGHRYRRLAEDEIAVIQGFPSDWAKGKGLTHRERIAGLGNAIPPPLGRALYSAMGEVLGKQRKFTAAEICAGFGGLALGGNLANNVETLALVEFWEAAVRVLRTAGHWDPSTVHLSDVKEFDWSHLAGKIDILSGGPPCQPWSQAGLAMGADDERDLLGFMPDLVGQLQPKAFFFENVPGLLSPRHQAYVEKLVARLRKDGEYGVAVGTVQAADYGVPQRRKRVIIAGVRGRPAGTVHDFFDQLFLLRTHANPRKAIPAGCRPWKTLGEALPNWSDGTGWRRWIDTSSSQEAYAFES